MRANQGGVFVYRPEIIQPILDSDPAFYRPKGEDDLASITRVSISGDNGELLGYGARNRFITHGAKVTISDECGVLFMFFVSDPLKAELYADARMKDITDYTGQALTYTIEKP